MFWQNSDDLFIEELQTQPSSVSLSSQKVLDNLEEKKAIQLNKFQDPATDVERQTYISIATQFGDLLANNYIDELIITMLTEDCEFFRFSSTGRASAQYSLKPEGIKDLYKGVQVQERLVKETYVDKVKSTVIQLSQYKILYQDERIPVEEYAIEILTIKDGKISKYRGSFGCKPHDDETDPLERTRKDKLLAKVKQINYALAGSQPDLHKVEGLLNENTEYKIWSWESQKCFTFSKRNFAENFRNLEVNLAIKCIVPYDVFTEKKYAISTYAYYLEGKSGIYTNQKYVWLSTCVYSFDEKLNITRVSQQGELHKEDNVEISFEAFSRESIIRKIQEGLKNYKPSLDLFYNNVLSFSCPLYRFAPEGARLRGLTQGIDEIRKILNQQSALTFQWAKILEVYVDSGDASYDVAITIGCDQLSVNGSEGKTLNHINIVRLGLENGKISKGVWFAAEISEPVPSPFEDLDIETSYIKSKHAFL